MSIKAVIFDMGGPLIPSLRRYWNEMERERGLEHNSIWHTMMEPEGAAHQRYRLVECGELSCEEFEHEFMLYYRQKYNKPELAFFSTFLFIHEPFSTKPDVVFPESRRAIVRLKELGYKVACLTNNYYVDKEKKVSCVYLGDMRDKFDCIVESCKVGARKPERAVFDRVLSQLAVGPSEAVFCDDIPLNLSTPGDMGMRTVLVTSAAQMVAELQGILHVDLQ